LTIRINPDRTFEYRLNGDLYNDLRYRGTWRFIGRNRIRAISPENRSAPIVAERATNRGDRFIVIVQDFAGALAPGVEISGVANGSAFRVRTNDEGFAEIPKCQQFEVAFIGYYRGVHTVVNPQADEFTVTLTVDQTSEMAIDETWLVEGNRLYVIDSGGSNRDYYLRRLGRREERRIFR